MMGRGARKLPATLDDHRIMAAGLARAEEVVRLANKINSHYPRALGDKVIKIVHLLQVIRANLDDQLWEDLACHVDPEILRGVYQSPLGGGSVYDEAHATAESVKGMERRLRALEQELSDQRLLAEELNAEIGAAPVAIWDPEADEAAERAFEEAHSPRPRRGGR